jgi:hypothetical protein
LQILLNIPDDLYEKHLKGYSEEELKDWISGAICQKMDLKSLIELGLPSNN